MGALALAGGSEGESRATPFDSFLRRLLCVVRRASLLRLSIRRERRLRLRETLSLGERRLVAIVECDRKEFLVAATGQTISLLAPLERSGALVRPMEAAERKTAQAGQ
jgi:flagellar biogenesis protein FliO